MDTGANGPANFKFKANNSATPANFTLDDDADPTLSNTQALSTLVDGQTYVVTETSANAGGVSLTDLECVGGGADTSVLGAVATIGFDAGETIVCTFENTQQGGISIVKDTVPNGPANFTFTANNSATPANSPSLHDALPILSNTQALSTLVDGQTYVVTETSAN